MVNHYYTSIANIYELFSIQPLEEFRFAGEQRITVVCIRSQLCVSLFPCVMSEVVLCCPPQGASSAREGRRPPIALIGAWTVKLEEFCRTSASLSQIHDT